MFERCIPQKQNTLDELGDIDGKTLWFPHAYEDNTRYYVLSNSDDCNSLVSLDKETFVQIGTSTYYRDKNDIYSYITGIDTNDLHPLHADTSTFEILRYGFARDKDYVYYPAGGDGTIGAIVKGADAGSFENLVGPYAKDKSQVYFVNQPSEGFAKVTTIEGADTKTFEIVRSGNGSASVAKDKNRVYFRDTEIAGLSPSTLRTFSLSPRLLADNLGVYYNGMLIPEIEASTFSIGTTTGEVTLASDIHHNYQITKDGSDAQLLSLKVISTH